MRKFETGATRNDDQTKNDYEGFIDPEFLVAFGDYMTIHRIQADGTLRDSDNWQKGIPLFVYMKSLLRHVFDLWRIHRGHKVYSPEDGHELTAGEMCCAIFFNTQGYWHELQKGVK
jgi:hypothetical protein